MALVVLSLSRSLLSWVLPSPPPPHTCLVCTEQTEQTSLVAPTSSDPPMPLPPMPPSPLPTAAQRLTAEQVLEHPWVTGVDAASHQRSRLLGGSGSSTDKRLAALMTAKKKFKKAFKKVISINHLNNHSLRNAASHPQLRTPT